MPFVGLEPTSNSLGKKGFSAEHGPGVFGRSVARGNAMVGVAQDLKKPRWDRPDDLQFPSGGDPASFAQQRLWFVDRLRPGSPAYHLPAALRLTGQLDAAVAERSLCEPVYR